MTLALASPLLELTFAQGGQSHLPAHRLRSAQPSGAIEQATIGREQIVRAGLATAQDYGWDKIAEKYLKLFDDLRQPDGVTTPVAPSGTWTTPEHFTTQRTGASV